MGTSICIKPSGLPEVKNKPWQMVIRTHDLSGTDYSHLAWLNDAQAGICENCGMHFLYGPPDWDKRAAARELERARVLREQAAAIEAQHSDNI